MSASEHYGEQARPWPMGRYWDDDDNEQPFDRGYFMDYRDLFDDWVEAHDTQHLFVDDASDKLGAWRWQVGSFSWTPDGDIYQTRVEGLAPNRSRAVAEGHAAALTVVRRDAEWKAEYDRREAERRATT